MGTLPGMRFYPSRRCRRQDFLFHRTSNGRPGAADQAAMECSRISSDHKARGLPLGSMEPATGQSEGDPTSGNLVAYEWRSKDSWKVIVVNFAGGASQGRIPF